MTSSEILAILLGAVIGGSGLCGMMFYYLRRYIDSRLQAAEAATAERRKQRQKRRQLEDAWMHSVGRLLFWTHQGIVKPPPNGELEDAFNTFQQAEADLKELDREILASAREDD